MCALLSDLPPTKEAEKALVLQDKKKHTITPRSCKCPLKREKKQKKQKESTR